MRSSPAPAKSPPAQLGALFCAFAFLIFALGACGHSNLKVVHQPAPGEVVIVKQGPPPHAPAHGYRHKHGKTELRYDEGLAVYVVVGQKDCYYQDGSYFRLSKGSWEMSLSTGGPWKLAPGKSLPPGLAKKYGPGAGGKGHTKKK